VAAAVVATGAGVLLAQQRRPLLGYAAVATGGIAVLGHGLPSNVSWFAVCLLGAWCVLTGSRRDGLVYWAAAMALFAAEWLWVKPDPGWGAWMAGTTLSVLGGLLIHHEVDLVAQLRAAQAGLAERARAEERNRIARELHDVIAHTLTVLLLHVSSARLAVEHDPADAARALAEAERLGRECLAEIRTTVGMLREDEDGGDGPGGVIAPLPGVDALPALVERFRSAGADVTLTVDGDVGGLGGVLVLSSGSLVQASNCLNLSNVTLQLNVSTFSGSSGSATLTAGVSGCITAPGSVELVGLPSNCPANSQPTILVQQTELTYSFSLSSCTSPEPSLQFLLLVTLVPIFAVILSVAVILSAVPACRRRVFPFAGRRRWSSSIQQR